MGDTVNSERLRRREHFDLLDAYDEAQAEIARLRGLLVEAEAIKRDAAWLAGCARGSSWPGSMANSVENAAERVMTWAVAALPDDGSDR